MEGETKVDVSREEKLKAASDRKKRRRRENAKVFAVLTLFLVLVAAAVFGCVLLVSRWERQKEDVREAAGFSEPDLSEAEESGAAGPDASGTAEPSEGQEQEASGGEGEETVPVISDAVIYSQEELDAKIAEAVAAAQGEEADRVLEGIKAALSEGITTVETLRPYYPDEIVVVSGGRFHFVPINRELAQNQLDAANLNILESGEFQYLTDGQVTSHKGIDVSSHQGDIDWGMVAQDGVEFAMIRVGFRGYGTGKLVEDEKFDANISGAIEAGIKVGVYFFSQAVTEEEVLEEANLVLEKIAPYQLDCPVVFDVEKISGAGRMNDISIEERTHLTLLFLQTIENAGHHPMVYYNTEMSALMIDIAALEGYDKWYASYSDQMFYPYEYKIWQYSDKGKVQGIKTDVDLNISFAPVW